MAEAIKKLPVKGAWQVYVECESVEMSDDEADTHLIRASEAPIAPPAR